MSVCKHPNNVDLVKRECDGNKKYNICYGENMKFKDLQELDDHVLNIEKDANNYKELRNIYSTGCWKNENNKPFLKDWNKLDEMDPIKCMTDGFKWITGDGYSIMKKQNEKDLNNETANKIDVNCSPGYEGDAFIEIDGCDNYTEFKEGDKGEYQQFKLTGCNECSVKYSGNRVDKEDKTCYPECGVLGTTIFDDINSNENYRFIDTKLDSEFKEGERRAGYCCNNIKNAQSMMRIKGSEKSEGSNILECSITACSKGYIKDSTGKYCCRKIENSRDDIEYICGLNSEETEPKDKEINYCNDGYKNDFNDNGLYSCTKEESGEEQEEEVVQEEQEEVVQEEQEEVVQEEQEEVVQEETVEGFTDGFINKKRLFLLFLLIILILYLC